jgi:hypothetical protein
MANQEENDVFPDFNLGSHSMTIENGRTRFVKVWEEVELKKVELKRSKNRDSIEMTVQEASSEELEPILSNSFSHFGLIKSFF